MIQARQPIDASLELAQLRRLELASVIEATTLVILIGVAVPLKHLARHPELVGFMGPVHGIAFCSYIWTLVQTVAGGDWRRAEWLRLAITAVVPFAGYTNLDLIRRKATSIRAHRDRVCDG